MSQGNPPAAILSDASATTAWSPFEENESGCFRPISSSRVFITPHSFSSCRISVSWSIL
eukprot:Gb_06369 [translate_table: standard]